MDFSYASQKFSAARSNLMLPHSQGESASIASAFHECSLGLMKKNLNELDDEARSWVQKLEEFMDTSGLEDPSGKGLWMVKAEKFSNYEKLEISRLIDELAHWFRSNRK